MVVRLLCVNRMAVPKAKARRPATKDVVHDLLVKYGRADERIRKFR